MNPSSRIRYHLARPVDALAIGKLARRVTRRWILPDLPSSATPLLLAGMSARVIRRKIVAGQRFHLACQEDGRVVGVAAMRDDSHLFQFFVSTGMQRRGIARRLWRRVMRDAMRRAGTGHFTLKSSMMAVPVYRHLGFEPDEPLLISAGGVITQPMHLDLA